MRQKVQFLSAEDFDVKTFTRCKLRDCAIILMTKHLNFNENLLDKQSAFHVWLGLKITESLVNLSCRKVGVRKTKELSERLKTWKYNHEKFPWDQNKNSNTCKILLFFQQFPQTVTFLCRFKNVWICCYLKNVFNQSK